MGRLVLAWSLAFFTPPSVLAQAGSGGAGVPATAKHDVLEYPPDFSQLSARATAAREANRMVEALDYYRKAVEVNSGWSEGWWYLATLDYDASRYSDAIPAFRRLLALQPQTAPAWALLGLAEFETRDYEDSLRDMMHGQNLGIEDNPELVEVVTYHIALLLIYNGKFEKAQDLIQSQFGASGLSDQARNALGMAMLRIPLLPTQVDPSNDALIQDAGIAEAQLLSKDPRALQTLHELLKQYPRTPFLHYAYATSLAARSHYAEAEQELQEERRITPWSALPHVQLALIKLRLGKTTDALKSTERAVAIAPSSFAAHDAFARVLVKLGKNEQAASERAVASKFDREVAEPFAKQAAVYGIAAGTDQQEALNSQPDGQGQRKSAVLAYTSAHYAEAIALLKKLVQAEPDFGPSWGLLGLCEFEIGDYKNSLIHLERGRTLGITGNPESVSAVNYHLALLLNLNKQFEKAAAVLADEVRARRATEQVSFALGISLLRIAALPDDIPPSEKQVVQVAGEAATLLSNSKYDQAFAVFQQMLKQYPETPFLHYAYAGALESISRFEDAKTQLKEELRHSPPSALLYTRIAAIDLKLDNLEESLRFANQAVTLDSQSAAAHEVLGRAALELHQTDHAIRELERANGLAPENPQIHFQLARAYSQAKLQERATKERAIFDRLNASSEQQKSAENGSTR